MNPFKEIQKTVRNSAKPTFTGKTVVIEWRPQKGKGEWKRFDSTRDYVAAVVLPRFSKDKVYQFRIRP